MRYRAFGVNHPLPRHIFVVVKVLYTRHVDWQMFQADADLSRPLRCTLLAGE